MDNNQLISRSKIIIVTLLVASLFFAGVYLMVGAPGFNLTGQPLQIVQIVGSFMAVTISTQFLYVVLIRPIDDYKQEVRLGGIVESKLDSMFPKSIHFGFQGFKDKLDFCELFHGLNSDNTLWWLDTYDPHYRTWLKCMDAALQRGAKINILAMNPNSPLVNMRASELGQEFSGGVFESELSSFIECLNNIKKESKYGDNLQVLTYSDLPSAPIYIVDKKDEPMYGHSSYFLGTATGIGFPHMCWTKQIGGGFLAELANYVRDKWQANS